MHAKVAKRTFAIDAIVGKPTLRKKLYRFQLGKVCITSLSRLISNFRVSLSFVKMEK